MKIIYSKIVVASALALVVAGTAYAQDRTALLTNVEVARLVAAGGAADHAQLRDHFASLANVYARNAVRNEAVARTMTGNPNHPPAVIPGVRYLHIAEQERKSAATLRELAEYHGSRAAGRPASFPQEAAQFESGEGAPWPTEGHIRELVASARTAADHRALETYFANEAERYLALAGKHRIEAQMYRMRANDRTGSGAALALHCEREAEQARHASDNARAAAMEQRHAASRG